MRIHKQKISTKSILVSSVALLGLMSLASPAFASVCASTTTCTLTLTQSNSGLGLPTGNYGTVTLTNLGGNSIEVSISLASGFGLISTGFPGGPDSNGTNYGVGFSDTVGALTISNFSSSSYSGIQSDSSQDLKFDGFGSVSNAAAHTDLGNTSGLSSLTFDVSGPNSDVLDNVNQLLVASSNGTGPTPYFIVDVYDGATGSGSFGKTGLLGAFGPNTPPTQTPEPSTLAIFFAGLLGCALFANRRRASKQN